MTNDLNISMYFDDRGRVISREKITDDNWTYNISVENVRFVSNLRRLKIIKADDSIYTFYEMIDVDTKTKEIARRNNTDCLMEMQIESKDLFKYLTYLKSLKLPERVKDIFYKCFEKFIMNEIVIRKD